MMQIRYEDQSAYDLLYSLHDGDVDMKPFTVLCTGNMLAPGIGQIEAGIIGASHFFTISDETGRNILTEVLACKASPSESIVFGGIRDINQIQRAIDGLTYEFSVRMEGWSTARGRVNRIQQDCSAGCNPDRIGLRYEFPSADADPFPATTLVLVTREAAGSTVKVETIHGYPNEQVIVFSESIISIQKKKGEKA